MEFNLIIGGEAGQGAFSVEQELADILARLRYYFFATKNYMSRVRGCTIFICSASPIILFTP